MAFGDMPSGGVAWENDKFTVPDHTSGPGWIEAIFSPEKSSRKALGSGGTSRIDGVFHMVLNYPKQRGSGEAAEVADKLVQWFRSGTYLNANGITVTCVSAERRRNIKDQKWYRVPIMVHWYTHTTDL